MVTLSKEQKQEQKQQKLKPKEKEVQKEWIRGVNIGGWLMAERFITPYLFAINTYHLEGSLCWYPGQIGAPSTPMTNTTEGNSNNTNDNLFCDTTSKCQPVLAIKAKPPTDYHLIHGIDEQSNIGNNKGVGINKHGMDYPVDEYTLGQVLRSQSIHGIQTATNYMERHWDTFLTYQDLETLQTNGVTHLRIPMGYWIRNNDLDTTEDNNDEPFIPGGWKYFVRACQWARELNLTVWADLHGGT